MVFMRWPVIVGVLKNQGNSRTTTEGFCSMGHLIVLLAFNG